MSVKKAIIALVTLLVMCLVISIVINRGRLKTARAATKSTNLKMAEAGVVIKQAAKRVVATSGSNLPKRKSRGIFSPLMQAALIKIKAALALGSIIIGSIAFHSILDRGSNRGA